MLRVTPMTIEGKTNHIVPDCATGGDSTSGGSFNGSVIDRLALGRSYRHAQPFLIGRGLANTGTGGLKTAKLDVYLSHGDSSGGGDLAEIDTGLRTAQQAGYSTEGTTEFKNYTTGSIRLSHYSNPYDLLGAKRFIAPTGVVTRGGVTTATAEANLARVNLGISLLDGDEAPPEHKALIPGGDDVLFATATNT